MNVSPTSDIVSPDQLCDRCLELYDQGLSLFPVGMNDRGEIKKPLIKGFHQPAASAREIRRWPWNRALALGWSLPVGVVGLDVDVKNGRTGLQDLQWLEESYGTLPTTATQITPSGGFHRLFTADPESIRKMAAHPRVMGSRVASIDIAFLGRLFLRVYDDAFPDMDIASMPPEWVEALLEARKVERALDYEPLCTGDTSGVLAVIRAAEQGHRNDTLYKAVGALSCQGLWTPRAEQQVEAAARAAGLEDDEIEGTIASGRSRFIERADFAEKWLAYVRSDDQICRSSISRRSLLRVAGALADLHIRYGDNLGLSVRDASIRAGIGKSTAHDRLLDLSAWGYVSRHGSEVGHSMTYRLKLPRRHSDTSTVVGSGSTATATSPHTAVEVSELQRQRFVQEFSTHDLFLRLGTTRGAPSGGAEVLAALVAGANTIAGISELSGLSRPTARKYLKIFDLPNLGLLTYTPRKVPVAVLEDGPLIELLDRAALRLRVNGVGEVRAAQYRREREDYALKRAGGSRGAISRLLNRRVDTP